MEIFERNFDENKVNLKCLFFDILRKWKVFIGGGILGLLLGILIYFIPSPEITMNEINFDNVLIERVADYAATQDMMQYQLQYESESPLMQIDPENVYEVTMCYYITARNTDIELISLRFHNILSDESVRDELYVLSGLTCNVNYVKELVSSSYSLSSAPSVQLNNAEDIQAIPRNSQLTFHIQAQTQEQCQALFSALKKYIDDVDRLCQQEYNGYSLQLLNEQHTNGRSDSLIALHQNAVDKKLSYAETITKYENSFTDDEKAYAKLVYPTSDEEGKKALNLMSVVLFIFAIEFILLAYYFMRSIFNRSIRYSTLIKEVFNLYVIAHLESPCKYKGIDAWLYHLEHKNDLPAVSREYLLQTFNMLDAQKLIVCGDRNDATLSELADWLAAACNKVQSIGSLHQDDNALAAAKNADGIVFLVRIDQTTRDEVKRNLDICRQMNFPVIGAVTIE